MSLYRLRLSAFGRPEESAKVKPKRIVFLSVEGDVTEKDYFERLNEHLDKSVIRVEVLRRKKGSGYNDPNNIVELLKEYFALRAGNIIPDEIKSIISQDCPDIEEYIKEPEKLTRKRRNEIQAVLLQCGIDIEYRKYLKLLGTDRNSTGDIFGVLIDRDCGCHSKEVMQACIKQCKILKVGCYISNPCFEFWLLLHLCDVKAEFSEAQLEELRKNNRIAGHNTVIGLEVWKRAGHKKGISMGIFDSVYWLKIAEAIRRSKEFACDCYALLDGLGSNVSVLIEEMDI